MLGRIVLVWLGAAILTILPLPIQVTGMRPAWILLSLIYIQSYVPKHFHVFLVLCLGLSLDALLSTPMGEHAFALLTTTWLLQEKIHRFKFFSLVQQMAVVGVTCACYQLILWIAEVSFGHMTVPLTVLGVAASSMLAWMVLLTLLNSILYQGAPSQQGFVRKTLKTTQIWHK